MLICGFVEKHLNKCKEDAIEVVYTINILHTTSVALVNFYCNIGLECVFPLQELESVHEDVQAMSSCCEEMTNRLKVIMHVCIYLAYFPFGKS